MNKVFWPRLSFYNQHRIEIGLNKSVEVFLEVDWLQKLPKKEDQCEEVTFYFVLQSIWHCQSVIMPEQYIIQDSGTNRADVLTLDYLRSDSDYIKPVHNSNNFSGRGI